MDKFEKQFDDLDVRSGFMEGAMGEATSTSTPQGEVDSLVSQVAAKAGLDLADQLSGAGTVGTSVATAAPAAAAPGTLRIVSFDPHTPPAPRYVAGSTPAAPSGDTPAPGPAPAAGSPDRPRPARNPCAAARPCDSSAPSPSPGRSSAVRPKDQPPDTSPRHPHAAPADGGVEIEGTEADGLARHGLILPQARAATA